MDQSKDTTIHERGKIFWDCESLSVNPVFYNNTDDSAILQSEEGFCLLHLK